ncbi:MAG: hypothetical protein C4K49_03140 [Candidatus Thorarchaeota archaeon]|nr:MAG: hypothetical protein C4K49_03140 [Candidatus Thorarchaeota archaeon]
MALGSLGDRLSQRTLPSSFYSTLITFGVFFLCLNMYIFTSWLQHPLASNLWLLGAFIAAIGLVFSWHMVRVHQHEMIERKQSAQSG